MKTTGSLKATVQQWEAVLDSKMVAVENLAVQIAADVDEVTVSGDWATLWGVAATLAHLTR